MDARTQRLQLLSAFGGWTECLHKQVGTARTAGYTHLNYAVINRGVSSNLGGVKYTSSALEYRSTEAAVEVK